MLKQLIKKVSFGFILLVCLIYNYDFALATQPLSDSEAKEIIAKGRNYNFTIPVGDFYVTSALEDAMGGSTGESLLNSKDMEFVRGLQKIGIITISEYKLDTTQSLELMGKKKIKVSLTDKAKQIVSKTEDGYTIKVGEIKVTKIVKKVEHKISELPEDDYRIILGVYDFIPTAIGQEYYAAIGTKLFKQYRLRALLKLNPFTNKYTYVVSDFGYLDKDVWETDHVSAYPSNQPEKRKFKGLGTASVGKQDEKAYMESAQAYFNKKQYDKAIDELNEAIEINPKNAEAYNNRGVNYYMKDQYDKATADYKKAIEIFPNYALAYYNLAVNYASLKNESAACDSLNKAIEKGYKDIDYSDFDDIRNSNCYKEIQSKINKEKTKNFFKGLLNNPK